MTLRVDKYVQPGGEGYLKWASRRLDILRAQREDLRLPAMSKPLQVTPDIRIMLKTTEFGDKIWIFVGSGFFVVYPRIKHIASEATYSAGPMLLNLGCTSITAPPGTFTRIGPPYRNSSDKVLTQAITGYFSEGKFVADPLAAGYMPFRHNYVDASGAAQRRLLATRVHNALPITVDVVTGTDTELSVAGDTGEIHDISPDGKKSVSLSGDTRLDFVINYQSDQQVIGSGAPLSGYGTTTDVTNNDNSYTAGPGPVEDPPGTFTLHAGLLDSAVQHNNPQQNVVATYPVCYGYSASNERQQISLVDSDLSSYAFTGTSTRTILEDTVLPSSPPVNYFSSADGTYSRVYTRKIVLPSGVEKSFDIERVAFSVVVTETQNTFSGNSSTAAGTGTRVSGTLEILYADASAGVVVYRHTQDTYTGATASGGSSVTQFVTMSNVGALVSRHIVVGVLAGTEEYEVFTHTEAGLDAETAGTEWPVAEGTVEALWATPFTNSAVNVTPIDSTPLSNPKARQQSEDLAISVKDTGRLIWQYKIEEDNYQIGSASGDVPAALRTILTAKVATDGQTVPTMAEINAFIQNLMATFGVTLEQLLVLLGGITLAQLIALVTALLTTSAQLTAEQKTQFLADLNAGTLDGYSITMDVGSSPHGVSLI